MGWSNLISSLSKSRDKSFALDERYETGDILGQGTFGVVRRAKIKASGEDVAIKIISRKEMKKMKVKEETVLRELELLQTMKHPHIVEMKSWYKTSDNYYIVTQLCTGGELFDRIIKVGKFTESDAAKYIKEIAEAVKYMHDRNVVHRDIKPENLLFTDTEPDAELVLADFGIARELDSENDTIHGGAGSLGYAAPDVFDREGHGKPCDVWSLGIIMYTLLCGYLPFSSESIEKFLAEANPHFKLRFKEPHWQDISPEAKDLLQHMLVYNPDKRATIEEVLDHSWIAHHDARDRDIYSAIRTGLSSLVRWRIGFEKVRLAQRLRSKSENSEENKDSANKFREVVMAAQRNNQIMQSQVVDDE